MKALPFFAAALALSPMAAAQTPPRDYAAVLASDIRPAEDRALDRLGHHHLAPDQLLSALVEAGIGGFLPAHLS